MVFIDHCVCLFIYLSTQCAFIAMADAGGHGVDEYLEANFQLPEEVSIYCHIIQSLSGYHVRTYALFFDINRLWL